MSTVADDLLPGDADAIIDGIEAAERRARSAWMHEQLMAMTSEQRRAWAEKILPPITNAFPQSFEPEPVPDAGFNTRFDWMMPVIHSPRMSIRITSL